MMINCSLIKGNKTACFLIYSLVVILSLLAACSPHKNPSPPAVAGQDTLPYPQVTVVNDLPQASQPREVQLDSVTTPAVSIVSTSVKGSRISKALVAKSPVYPLVPVSHFLRDGHIGRPVAEDAQGRGFFTTYSSDDGLALDEIYCSFRDRQGNLWFGTNGAGVSEYDGRRFRNFSTAQGLAYDVVWSIAEDDAGNLWFGTDGSGVSKFDGSTFTNYTIKDGLAGNVVYSIVKDSSGNLWMGTLGGGVSEYNGKGFRNYTKTDGLANNSVKSIGIDSSGNIWLGTLGGGVSEYDGNKFTNFSTAQGLAGDSVSSIAVDSNGSIWFGTRGGGVSKYDGKSFTNFSTAQGLAGNFISIILEDGEGNLWFGTTEGGVSKYNDGKFTNYTKAQGLSNNEVSSIVGDNSGNLWFSTVGGGVTKYEGKSFTNFTKAQGLGNSAVYSIAQDPKGNLWFGTYGGGVSKYDGQTFTNYTTAQGLANNLVYSIALDRKGNLWFGTYGGGISKYDGRTFTNYTTSQGLAYNVVYAISSDSKGDMWFGTSRGGVSKFDGKGFTTFTTTQGLAGNALYSIIEDRLGHLWFGTFGGGVSEYDGKEFTNFTTDQGLASNVVWTIKEDSDGDLWFGTQRGVSLLRAGVLDRVKKEMKQGAPILKPIFENYATEDGLPDNFVTQIDQESEDTFYVGTNQGICELLKEKSPGTTGKQYRVGKIFNSRTGYPVKDVNSGPGTMFKDSSGIFWIGTGSDKTGLVRFDPHALFNSGTTAPKVVIQGVKVNNQEICWNDLLPASNDPASDSNLAAARTTEEVTTFSRQLSVAERDSMRSRFKGISFSGITKWYPVPLNLKLPFAHNNISFDFNAIETGRNSLVKYQYMLDGYDKEWSPPSRESSASFGNIYEGTYTFRVKAESPEGIWSEPIAYTFSVIPPWWRTWWMDGFYGIMAIALVTSFIYWNSRRLIAQRNRLEFKVAVATRQIREEKEKVDEQKMKIEETLRELKSTQSQLIQSEKMASLGELTAGIAHEIQNPLNFVNNFSEVNQELLQEMEDEIKSGHIEEAKSIVKDVISNEEKINHHGKRAGAIVKGMLQHSRAGSGLKEPFNINSLTEEYLQLTFLGLKAKDKAFVATIKSDFDPLAGVIHIVPQDIGRVLLNLFSNAFYALTEKRKRSGGAFEPTLWVSTRFFPSSGERAAHVDIHIRDNGDGIPQKIVDKVFQPFFTTKPTGQGTGLGLSLSYDIIKAHSGKIEVKTTEGEGCEFIIELPA